MQPCLTLAAQASSWRIRTLGQRLHLADQATKKVPKYLPEALRAAAVFNWSSKQGVAGRFDRRAGSNMEQQSTPENKMSKEERSEKPEKSYLYSAVESISPWGGSRSSTPKLMPMSPVVPGEGSGLKHQRGADHTTQNWHGFSSKRYPPDCPPLNARWFHAVDVPKRKPKLLNKVNTEETIKPANTPAPKKFVLFSAHDSRSIETAYQKLADEYDDPRRETRHKGDDYGSAGQSPNTPGRKSNTSIDEAGTEAPAGGKFRVPVQEDFLFDVDIEQRELSPLYWLGPIYEVRRGSWFYQEGSTLRPCEENLAQQLEEGYLKIMPFRYPRAPEKLPKAGEDPRSLAVSGAFGRGRAGSGELTPKASAENLKAANQQALDDAANKLKDIPAPSPHQPQSYRLFGTFMNTIVTYQDSTVAWLSTDSIMARVSSSVYERFAGGAYFSGVKLVRGYSEGKTSADKVPTTPTSAASKGPNMPPELKLDVEQQKLLKRRSGPPSVNLPGDEAMEASARIALTGVIDKESEAEAVRKRDEREIRNDYNERDDENQGREIDHLILVTHGIGQRLGMRTESVNFIHDVNVLRKTLKSVYGSSADLQALNSEIDKLPKNCRIQNRREHDLGDAFGEDEEYPSLEDITVEGVPFVRSLITDLALDILLYQSAYREHIAQLVTAESNRVYDLFLQRNPNFKGKVSLIGHSLGSAIFFDILCLQKETMRSNPGRRVHQKSKHPHEREVKDLDLKFTVEDFYCLGSPIGLFQMLKGRSLLGRHQRSDAVPAESPTHSDDLQDPFLGFASGENISSVTGLPLTVSSPKVGQLYNIFHPSDPIAYRLEPLIAPAMSSMKPQLLPYTKRTITTSVSGIGAKVGQSVSGLWSSLSSGIASSLLNRSLGLTSDDVAHMAAPTPQRAPPQSAGAGTNVGAGVISAETTNVPGMQRQNTNEKKRQLAEDTAAADRDGTGQSPPTLIDDEIETLYAGFQKRRESEDGHDEWMKAEEKGRKLRREEAKVRALNMHGRVDYSIQESVLDFNPINTIASHLSYWADEDVSHFMMSQLLSRHRAAAASTRKEGRRESRR
ncbi:uncharacterized protein L3040_005619 [Drepanopeziza brunnea f. sp. 'multigermtubi']|uniref:uncharacterized protein n=1 Tax=Drepanopeziza brunnea f. sp. 'multigermtubi' TaxID=698441 RepID=UPI0023889A5A|nr:hypothetical protein L3040_005619 [Drepanopeziza brunnea f. sp. 'multigermtubi']